MGTQIGQVLEERYRLDALLGEGAFGAVFRARDLQADRDVAIKLNRPQDPRERARWQREIEVTAGLRDPHTVKVFNYGELDDGSVYLVLELVAGVDLSQLIEERGALSPDLVMHIARQVLASLREAHLAGIIHRDIKPQNIRVYPYGGDPHCVKLLDFGVARRPAADDAVTKTGELVGTPRYMAPEQLLSEPFTPSSDLYGLGIVMLEMLLGEAPHGPSLGDQLDRLQTGHLLAVPQTATFPGLPAVIAKMTARTPEQRYGSAEAVIKALESAQRRPPAAALRQPQTPPRTPSPQAPPPGPPSAPNRTAWLFGIAIAVVALLAVVLGAELLRQQKPEDVPTVPAQRLAPQPASAEVASGVADERGPCGATSRPVPGVQRGGTFVGLVEHPFFQYVPEGLEPGRKYPLLLLLVREEMDAQQFFEESGFKAVADEEGVILLVPQPNTTSLDLAIQQLLREMVERTSERLCVDSARIFVVGHGSGGHAARRLSCTTWVAAAAEASARPTDPVSSCPDVVPYVLLSPMKSLREPLDGGRPLREDCKVPAPLLSISEHEQALLSRSGCRGDGDERLRHQEGTCTEWTCDDGPFMHCRIDGGSGWPGRERRAKCDGEPAAGFPAARVIWEFFDRSVPAVSAEPNQP